MDLSESDNPLLNDYKLTYVLKLLLQTFLGGVRLKFDFHAPAYIYYMQMIIWILPFLFSIFFTLIVELGDFDEQLCALIFGLLMLALHTNIYILVFILKQRVTSLERATHNFLAEEDEIEFVSFLSMETLEFLIPKKKLLVSYFFHSLICGVLCCFSFMFLLPQRTDILFDNPVGSWFYYVIGWLIVCVACYPLIGQQPKEPALFHIVDNWEILPISRSCYVLGFGVFSYVARFIYPTIPLIGSIDYIIHIIFLFLPFLWLFGFLPPPHALILWIGEQVFIHMMGGSMMATDGRLFIMLVVSWLSVILFHFISLKTIASFIILGSLSFLISLDVCSLVMSCMKKIQFRLTRINYEKKKNDNVVERKPVWFIVYVFFMLILVNTIVLLSEHHLTTIDKQFNTVAGLLFVLTFLNKLLCSLQQVYIFFSIVRNPIYSKVCKKYGCMWLISVASTIVRLILLPLCLLLVVCIILIPKKSDPLSFLSSIFMFRAYRMIWQNTSRCCYDILLYILLLWATNFNPAWANPSLQLFIISMVVYFITSLANNLWFIFLLLFNSQTKQKKQQKKVSVAMMITFCLLPVTLFVVAMTTITSAPLLPLFTLPLFIVGFPRPLRMWPQASSSTRSSSKDWIYYKQLSSSIVEEIRHKFWSNGINTFTCGSYFLARFQDRLIWITILESGITHCNFVIKGLELQETSCHATEADSIDNNFHSSFETHNKNYNEYMTSVLTPKFSLDVNAYSDARNVLTGIIDSPQTLKSISNFFPKVLLWVLIKYCLHRRKMGLEDDEFQSTQLIDQGSYFTHRTEETNMSAISKDVSQCDEMIIPKMPIVENNNNNEETFISSPEEADNKFSLAPIGLNKTMNKPVIVENADDSDDEFGDFGFSDEDLHNESDESSDEEDYCTTLDETIKAGYSNISTAAKIVDPPSSWKRDLPFTEDELASYSNLISQDWFGSIILSLSLGESETIKNDLALFKMYKLLVLSCFYVVDIAGVRENSSVKEGPGHVLKVFHGEMPWSPHSSWLERDEELRDLVVQAYRYAFKLAFDNHVLGEFNSDEEVLDMLMEYEENWFIGEEDSEKWMRNVLEEKPYLLSILQEKRKNVFTSRSLSKQLLEVPMGELNSECVRGFWSALSLELYYMTNDDDERYSIQALPPMLRNVITQAADPPLGYPVYSSGLLGVSI